MTGAIEYHDAKIIAALSLGVAVGDINVAVMRIERDFRHAEKLRRARIQGRAVHGSVRGIKNAFFTDLQQQRFTYLDRYNPDAYLRGTEEAAVD